MEIWKHVAFSAIIVLLLHYLYGLDALLAFMVFAGGVLIDIDHYLWRMYKNKEFNPLDCYSYYKNDSPKNNYSGDNGNLHIFHTIEFLIAAVLLAFYRKPALMFVIGLLGHYLLDFIWHITVPKRVILNHSMISWIIKNKIRNYSVS